MCDAPPVRAVQVRSSDGTLWAVRSFRVRVPPWRPVSYLIDEAPDDAFAMALNVVLAPLAYVLLPLLWFIVELPLVIVRSLGSDVAWVQATSDFPHESVRLWRTSRADRAVVTAAVVEALSAGRGVAIARAELVEAT